MVLNPKQTCEKIVRAVVSDIQLKRRPFLTSEEPGSLVIPRWFRQLIKFGLVGVSNTLVDAGVYFLLSRSGLLSSFVLAKGLSYFIGMLNSFYWNKTWTFKSRVEARQEIISFIGANLLAVGLNAWVMYLALDAFGLPELVALAVATAATFFWNFALSKFFIFK